MIIYYSATGNSLAVATAIADATGDRLFNICEALRNENYSINLCDGEALGFIWPVYAWAPPALVLEFVRKLDIVVPSGTYAWCAATYASNIALGMDVFRDELAKKGIKLRATFGIRMPEAYITFPGMHLDSPGRREKKLADARIRLEGIIADIKSARPANRLDKGLFPYLSTRIISKSFTKYGMDDRGWKVSDRCIACGKCASVCPLGNITIDGKPHWNGHCTMCNACYHSCPVNAINYGRLTSGKGQYAPVPADFFLVNHIGGKEAVNRR